MAIKKFQRTEEEFVCEQCGFFVHGNGYTNHCPRCLWSKHVDLNPGDRQASCQGLMKPVGVKFKAGKYIVLHRCLLCGFEKWNKIEKEDNFEVLFQLPGWSTKHRKKRKERIY